LNSKKFDIESYNISDLSYHLRLDNIFYNYDVNTGDGIEPNRYSLLEVDLYTFSSMNMNSDFGYITVDNGFQNINYLNQGNG
jgi:hypothetical protein